MASKSEIRGFKIRAFVASVLIPGAGVLYALVQTRTQLRDEPDDVKSGVFMAGSIWLVVQVVLLLAVLVTA
jgi:hypothetical protein